MPTFTVPLLLPETRPSFRKELALARFMPLHCARSLPLSGLRARSAAASRRSAAPDVRVRGDRKNFSAEAANDAGAARFQGPAPSFPVKRVISPFQSPESWPADRASCAAL